MRAILRSTLRTLTTTNNVRKSFISVLLSFAVALVTVAPPQCFAQARVQPEASTTEARQSTSPAAPTPDLRTSVATTVAKVKSGPLTEADLKRLQNAQNQQTVPPPKSGMSRKQKIFIALTIVLLTGAIWVAIKHRCKAPDPCPVIDDTSDSFDY